MTVDTTVNSFSNPKNYFMEYVDGDKLQVRFEISREIPLEDYEFIRERFKDFLSYCEFKHQQVSRKIRACVRKTFHRDVKP